MKRMKAAAILVAGALLIPATASAQPGAAAVPGTLTLSPAEQAALLPLKQAVDARNWAAASAALPAARAAARSDDARYAVGRMELEIATGTNNQNGQTQAISALLETRGLPADERAELLRRYAGVAYEVGNLNLAEHSLNRVLQAVPNDPEALSMLAQLNRNRNRNAEAISFFQRALRAAEASGRRLPESRYRVALALAEQTGQRPLTVEFARHLVAAHPDPINWRDAIVAFRTTGTVDPAIGLDALRLQRAAGGLAGERDYLGYVRALAGVSATEANVQAIVAGLDRADAAGEAKAALDQGVAARMLDPQEGLTRGLIAAVNTAAGRERTQLTSQVAAARTGATATPARAAADGLLGSGRHAEAAELYRLALTRAGEDPNLVNSRLGMALALAGQRAEAEAALRSVTGPRAELAGLWLAWLARPTA